MKNSITISFPLGAVFYSDPVEYTYKSFLKMVKRFSCVNQAGKCIDCPLQSKCQYYAISGRNFNGYPGVLFKRHLFEKAVFQKNENHTFEVFFVGNCRQYQAYIDIFLNEYLDYRLAGQPYVIKAQFKDISENKQVLVNSLKVKTIVESKDFTEVYNDMVDYYNEYYETCYQPIKQSTSENEKVIKQNPVKFPTKKVYPSGYTFQTVIEGYISSDFLETGVGRYNYLGGGQLEIND